MNSWFFIPAIILLLTIGNFLDKHYLSKKTSSKFRDLLIKYYVWIDDNTPKVDLKKIKDSLYTPFVFITRSLIALVISFLLFYGTSRLTFLIIPFIALMIIAIIYYNLIFFLRLSTLIYPISRFIVLHFINKSTDSKHSPFTFTLSTLIIIFTLLKLIFEFLNNFKD